jgi:hypothetical protein
MKIKLSKSDWDNLGFKNGWLPASSAKTAADWRTTSSDTTGGWEEPRGETWNTSGWIRTPNYEGRYIASGLLIYQMGPSYAYTETDMSNVERTRDKKNTKKLILGFEGPLEFTVDLSTSPGTEGNFTPRTIQFESTPPISLQWDGKTKYRDLNSFQHQKDPDGKNAKQSYIEPMVLAGIKENLESRGVDANNLERDYERATPSAASAPVEETSPKKPGFLARLLGRQSSESAWVKTASGWNIETKK